MIFGSIYHKKRYKISIYLFRNYLKNEDSLIKIDNMPTRIPVYLSDQYLFDAFSDDTILLIKQKICSKTGLSLNDIHFNDIEFKDDFKWQSSRLLSQYIPFPEKIVTIISKSKTSNNKIPLIFIDEQTEKYKKHIFTFFRNQKKTIHELLTITKGIFEVSLDKVIKYSKNVDKNFVCLIESESSIDAKQITLYKDIRNIESNQNIISSWWKDIDHRYFSPIIIKIIDQIEKLHPIYHDIFLKTYTTNTFDFIYSSHEAVFLNDKYPLGLEDRLRKILKPFVDSLGNVDIKNIKVKEIEFKYEVFLSIDELSNILDSCRNLIDTFFDIPNEDKPFFLRYRPKYQGHPLSKRITVQFQQCKQNNSIIMVIHSFNNRFKTIQDVFEILYFLTDSKRLHSSIPTQISYKDLDPYLYKDAIRGGGYTRQCLNFNYKTLHKEIRRRKVPRILYTEKDFKLYHDLPKEHKRYALMYRGNCYAAIDDYIENNEVIEEYNAKYVKEEKKKESYLNTVVLFEIQAKYRDGTQEELFYPLCVRATSGLPSLKHQYILKKLIDKGEIQLLHSDAKSVMKKLENNEKLKRGDVIHYVSKFEGKLLADIYAFLPERLLYFLRSLNQFPAMNSSSNHKVLRKGVQKGSFVHAVFECCDPQYRKLISDKKVVKVNLCVDNLRKYQSYFRFRWSSFGILTKEMSYDSFLNGFVEKCHSDYRFTIDLFSEIFDKNIIVIYINHVGNLQTLMRNMEFKKDRKTILIVKWEGNFYEPILVTDSKKKQHTDINWFQHESNQWIAHLNSDIFNNIFSDVTSKLKYAMSLKKYLNNRFSVQYQVADVYNQCVGLVCYDAKKMCESSLLFIPITQTTLLPHIPMWRKEIPINTSITCEKILKFLKVFDPKLKITRILTHNEHYVGFAIKKGIIWPFKKMSKINNHTEEFDYRKFTDKDATSIPYLFGITHFRTKISNIVDNRIHYVDERMNIQNNLNILINDFHKIFVNVNATKKLWIKNVDREPNIVKRQNNIYSAMCAICDEYIFEEPTPPSPSSTDLFGKSNLIKMRNHNIYFEPNVLKKTIFHLFHYLLRNPKFYTKSYAYSKSRNDVTNSITFKNVQEANEWLKNTENLVENISFQKSNMIISDYTESLKFVNIDMPLVYSKIEDGFSNEISQYIPNFLKLTIKRKKEEYKELLQFFKGYFEHHHTDGVNHHIQYLFLSLILQKEVILKDKKGNTNSYGTTFSLKGDPNNKDSLLINV